MNKSITKNIIIKTLTSVISSSDARILQTSSPYFSPDSFLSFPFHKVSQDFPLILHFQRMQDLFSKTKTDHFCTTFSKCPLLIFVSKLCWAGCEPIVLENKIFYKRRLEFNSGLRNKHPAPPGVVETEMFKRNVTTY